VRVWAELKAVLTAIALWLVGSRMETGLVGWFRLVKSSLNLERKEREVALENAIAN
jgi:hypothetical protein